MKHDVTSVLRYASGELGKEPDVMIGQALECRLALECLKDDSTIPLIIWAPIIRFQTSPGIRCGMHEYRDALNRVKYHYDRSLWQHCTQKLIAL